MTMNRVVTDPIERIVADALTAHGIHYECDPREHDLDFRLPDLGLLIEVKQFSTDRTARQLAGRENVILIQGRHAAEAFGALLSLGAKNASGE